MNCTHARMCTLVHVMIRPLWICLGLHNKIHSFFSPGRDTALGMSQCSPYLLQYKTFFSLLSPVVLIDFALTKKWTHWIWLRFCWVVNLWNLRFHIFSSFAHFRKQSQLVLRSSHLFETGTWAKVNESMYVSVKVVPKSCLSACVFIFCWKPDILYLVTGIKIIRLFLWSTMLIWRNWTMFAVAVAVPAHTVVSSRFWFLTFGAQAVRLPSLGE